MSSSTKSNVLAQFMKSPLVTWIKTFHQGLDEKSLEYKGLCEGNFLFNVWLKIDPHPMYHGLGTNTLDTSTRIKNLDVLLHNIKAFYEEVLGQLLLIKPPDIVVIARNPLEEASIKEMKTLLLLILGSAVQCEQKQYFIEHIKTLDFGVQHDIVECIQQVTDNPEAVWINDWNELSSVPQDMQEHFYSILVGHLRQLVKDRDDLAQRLINLVLEQESHYQVQIASPSPGCPSPDKPHLQVELADVKARLRKVQQELEEKNESATEFKEELERTKDNLNKLRQENLELVQDARTAKAYRDEIDILTERVRRVDRLESELQRYKDKMNELDFYKSRVEEVRVDNQLLINTKTMIEEQLESCRKKVEQLESDKRKICAEVNDLTIDKDANREKILCLIDEINHLQMERKASADEFSQLQAEVLHLRATSQSSTSSIIPSLQDQINTDYQTRVFQLELENQRLRIMIENSPVSPEPEKLLEETNQLTIEKQKIKKELDLSIQKIADLETQNIELAKQVEELHHNVKNEKKKSEHLEQNINSFTTENQKHQRTAEFQLRKVEEVQRELQSLESENLKLTKTVDSLKLSVRRLNDLEKETTQLEADNHKLEQEKKGLEKETVRLKNAMEVKDSFIDDYSSRVSSLERDIKQYQREVEHINTVTTKVKSLEKENKDLGQQAALDKTTLSTLREELVNEKIKCQQLRNEIDRLSAVVHQNEQDRNIKEKQQTESQESGIEYENASLEDAQSLRSEEALVSQCTSEGSIDTMSKKEIIENCNLLNERICELRVSLTDIEKQKNSLDEENRNLVREMAQVRDQLAQSKSHNSALEHHLTNMNKHQGNLQSALAQLEVESSTLEAQNCSLASQLTELKAQVVCMEEQSALLFQKKLELEKCHASLMSHHDSLQKLHDMLTLDYETLNSTHGYLKGDHKSLKQEFASLKETLEATMFSQEEVYKLQKVLEGENSGRNLAQLRNENAQFKEQIKSLRESNEHYIADYKELQTSHKTLKTENNDLKLKFTSLQGDFAEAKSSLAASEIEVAKLSSLYELLSLKNASLEEEHLAVLQHVSLLLSQYNELLTQICMDRPEDHLLHQKLKEFYPEREKIDQRIAENCHQLEKSSSKRKHISPNSMRQIRRTRSAFLKSSHKESTPESSKTSLTRSKRSMEELSKEDLIPVRDETSHLELPKQERSSNYHTTIETHTTVNNITNLGKAHRNSPVSNRRKTTPSEVNNTSMESVNHSSIWYEYGCV